MQDPNQQGFPQGNWAQQGEQNHITVPASIRILLWLSHHPASLHCILSHTAMAQTAHSSAGQGQMPSAPPGYPLSGQGGHTSQQGGYMQQGGGQPNSWGGQPQGWNPQQQQGGGQFQGQTDQGNLLLHLPAE